VTILRADFREISKGFDCVNSVRAAAKQVTPKPELNIDALLDTALSIADAANLEAVTIRRLAREFDVAPMTIYGYVASKEDLLERMAARCIDQFEVPVLASADWREHVRAIAIELRRLMREHPALSRLFSQQRVTTQGLTRLIEAILVHLQNAGLTGPQAVDAFGAIFMHVLGSVVFEIPRRTQPGSDEPAIAVKHLVECVGDRNMPSVLALKHELSMMAEERAFEAGLDLLIGGIASAAASGDATAR
jgi:TetR/AcrR family transcriptional regulator, tetracycline repressor protein